MRMANRFISGSYGLLIEKVGRIGLVNPNKHNQGSIVNHLENDINYKFWNIV